MDTEKLKQLALEAVAADDKKGFEKWSHACESHLVDYSLWPDQLLAVVFELLMEPRVLEARTSYHIPRFLYEEARGLSSSQKAKLLPVIEESYPRFRDSLSCMCLAELVAQNFADRAGLKVLAHFKQAPREDARAFAAYGLRLFIQNTDDELGGEHALAELRAMMADFSIVVRGEVEHNLRILIR